MNLQWMVVGFYGHHGVAAVLHVVVAPEPTLEHYNCFDVAVQRLLENISMKMMTKQHLPIIYQSISYKLIDILSNEIT